MGNADRLEAVLGRFRSHPLVDRLRAFLVDAPDEELFHIDLDRLAALWDVERRVVLELFLRGVRFGLFNLEWAFHCPTCGGVARESLQLAHTHEQDFCPVCRVDFRNTLDENVEVFFTVGEEIRPLPSELGERYHEQIVQDITATGAHDWRTDGTVRGVDVLNHPVFRDVFGDDTLPMDQSLEIRSATILFTDVTGSTAMYERLGDARAYRLIRDHFDLVFLAIAENEGVPIKTIGDAVMGVFTDESSALRAAYAMTDALDRSNEERGDGEEITLKIGIHRGPVIAVTLNDRIDYFGRTVNLAARTQAVSGPRQLSMLPEFLRAPGVRDLLGERVSSVNRKRVRMKGIDGHMEVYRITLPGGAAFAR